MVRRELQQTREMKALNGAQGKAGDSLAKQRRISRSSSIGVGTKALLAAVVGIAFAAATLCSGRGEFLSSIALYSTTKDLRLGYKYKK